jgi:hypothetical protein
LKGRRVVFVRHVARQLEEDLRQQKISFNQLENFRTSCGMHAASAAAWIWEGSCSDLLSAASVVATSCSIQRRTSSGADLTCSGVNVKLVIRKSPFVLPFDSHLYV